MLFFVLKLPLFKQPVVLCSASVFVVLKAGGSAQRFIEVAVPCDAAGLEVATQLLSKRD